MSMYLQSVALYGPGLTNWSDHSRAIICGSLAYLSGDLAPFAQTTLPPNAARRAGASVRLALQVAQEALANAIFTQAQQTSTVFACSGGDSEALDKLLNALCQEGKPVSPNVFNNSVHNAAVAYWSIATASHAPAISLSAYDGSFSAGLLTAYSLLLSDADTVLLVAYDRPPPYALQRLRAVCNTFACAFIFSAEQTANSLFSMQLELCQQAAEDQLDNPALEQLRISNPAARSLVLLRLLAQQQAGSAVLPYLDETRLCVQIRPC